MTLFLRDDSCPCVSLGVLSSPGHMQRPHFTHLLPSSPFLCESICIFCFLLRAKPSIHFSPPLPPPPTFLLVLVLAAVFLWGAWGGSAASALAICKQFTAAPLPFPLFPRYLLGKGKQERDPFTDLRRLLQSSDLTLTGMLSDLD